MLFKDGRTLHITNFKIRGAPLPFLLKIRKTAIRQETDVQIVENKKGGKGRLFQESSQIPSGQPERIRGDC